ncbi:DGAT1/2-independent enzyme synthesizing storage lipids-like [Oscarella lobularis]|uniref:DGAT1/2-independent enzyme synthesizing storage lipids-like n=1 Tax=Oscarella lobularis TaxID=121494 RepID=UPI00331332DB
MYTIIVCLHVYKLRRRITDAYSHTIWDGARYTVAAFFDAQSRIWHDYQVFGLENIPDTGAALIVTYHGALALDMYYLISRIMMTKRRMVYSVVDRFLYKCGLRAFLDLTCCIAGTREKAVEVLKGGNLLCVAPGGVREALFSGPSYEIMWNKRSGFARVAMEANVPILPMFTKNIREVVRTFTPIGKGLLRKMYEKTRLPLVPLYGGLPVKLETYIGKPIISQCGETAEALALRVKEGVQALIDQYQIIPGSIPRALKERWISNHHHFNNNSNSLDVQ